MPNPEKQHDFISEQLALHQKRGGDAFRFFMQMAAAITGGSIWLRVQADALSPAALNKFAILSDVIIISLALLSAFMILDHLRGWHGYRWALTRLYGKRGEEWAIPPPNRRSMLLDFLKAGAALFYAGLFTAFNPFTLI